MELSDNDQIRVVACLADMVYIGASQLATQSEATMAIRAMDLLENVFHVNMSEFHAFKTMHEKAQKS